MNKPIIKIIEEDENHKVYYMYQDLSGLDLYDRAKATDRFINSATKTLETLISCDLRHFLKVCGIIAYDGSEKSLERAFLELEQKGKSLQVIDRYYEIKGEKIIGESPNKMTIIQESDNIVGCSLEVRLNVYDTD